MRELSSGSYLILLAARAWRSNKADEEMIQVTVSTRCYDFPVPRSTAVQPSGFVDSDGARELHSEQSVVGGLGTVLLPYCNDIFRFDGQSCPGHDA